MTDRSTHPYNLPSDPAKRHSAALTDGPDRAAARAMLKAIGFTDQDLARPLIGVATTWIETMPCNFNQRRLAEFVKEGIRAAGGTPMEFNTISISDGVSMGTDGMKASLVSREVIADSIELVARGHLFDGMVCLVGCDKTIPGAAMALVRLDRPGLVLYNGTIYPGTYKGKNADIVSVFEAVGAYRAGTITLDELYEIESASCPGAGACGGQYTANTMSTVMEFIGLSPAGLNGIPAEDPAKDAAARRCGELVMDLVRRDVRPSAILDRRALENGIAAVAATGGSTNGVLHLLAIAREAGIPLEIDDFGTHRRPDADRRRHEAGRALLRLGDVRRGRRGAGHARAALSRAAPRRRPHGGRPDDRGDRRGGHRDARPAGGRADRDADQADRRARRSSTARWPRTAASSSWPATSGGSSAARPASTTPRRPASRQSRPAPSGRATSSSSATRARSAGPGCRRC